MTEENADSKRAQALELCKQAIAEYAEVSGSQIVFKRDIPLTGRPGRPVMHEGIYFILDEEGTLGYVDTEALARSLEAVREEAKRRGAYEEHEVDGMTVATIGEGGDKSPIEFQATVIPLEAAGKPVTASEAAAYLAIDTAESEETKRFIFETLFKAESLEQPESIKTVKLDKVNETTTKLTHVAYTFFDLEPNQLAMALDEETGGYSLEIDLANAADRKKGLSRSLAFGIYFDDEELKRFGLEARLSAFDRQVLEAVCSFAYQGIYTFTDRAVYQAMGYKGNPGKADRMRLYKSLTKQNICHVFWDNAEEAAAYTYPHDVYDGSLLPMERVTRIVDGNITDGVNHLLAEPPILRFARRRDQIATYEVKVLQTPLSKTDKNLRMEQYIRGQILWMKHPKSKRNRKIRLSEIYDAAGITRRDDKLRKRADIVRLLEHYEECEFIKGYQESGDGFTIIL